MFEVSVHVITIGVTLIISLIAYMIMRCICFKRDHHMRSASLVSTMAVMGSGGHTQEMITLLSHLNIGSINGKYSPITLIASKDDHLSVNKVKQMTQSLSDCQLVSITRSRSVGQSYWTSVVTTMISMMESLVIVWRVRPKLVVCNGPGVCVPICLVAKLLVRDVCIIFVESFCRTESLSLSGRILYCCRICDHFLVQWPQLTHRYNRAKYIGLLV